MGCKNPKRGEGVWCVFGYRGECPTLLFRYRTKEEAERLLDHCENTPGIEGWDRFAVELSEEYTPRLGAKLLDDVWFHCLELHEEGRVITRTEIARRLEVTPAAISVALHKLREAGKIASEPGRRGGSRTWRLLV